MIVETGDRIRVKDSKDLREQGFASREGEVLQGNRSYTENAYCIVRLVGDDYNVAMQVGSVVVLSPAPKKKKKRRRVRIS